MRVVNRNEVPTFVTKDNSEIREIMAPANSSIERQSLAEATVYPGDCTFEHIHRTSEEIYYILSGEGVMWMDGEERSVGPLDAIAIPPGSSHKIRCTSRDSLVFLCICVPHYTHEDTDLRSG